MSASAFPTFRAIAFQLVATLGQYEITMGELVSHGFERDPYERASDEIDAIQRYSMVLPSTAVAAVSLLIAHAELIYALTHLPPSQAPLTSERVRRKHEELGLCVDALERSCKRHFGASRGAGSRPS